MSLIDKSVLMEFQHYLLNWLRKLTRVSPTSNRPCCHAVITVDGHYTYRIVIVLNHPLKDSIVAYTAVTASHRLTGEAIAEELMSSCNVNFGFC